MPRPSALAFGDLPTPTAINAGEIGRLVQAFGEAAARAFKAGFKVVEIHGAHGYLIHSFLSPHTNRRTDHYGDSFENRTRFALEVVDAVRSAWPRELPVLFRISATDWLTENPNDPREGWTNDDTLRLVPQLAARGVDLIDTSTGGIAPDATIPVAPGFQVPFAAEIRNQAGLPVGAVGLITEPKQAANIIDKGAADAVFLGRELLRNPYWPHQAAHQLGTSAQWPPQYCHAL